MCKKRSSVKLKLPNGKIIRLDPCMREEIFLLNKYLSYFGDKTLACCCGHGVYPTTIVLTNQGETFVVTLKNKIKMKRKKRFYKTNKKTGLMFIPEVEELKK
jgi:hypothetical protein